MLWSRLVSEVSPEALTPTPSVVVAVPIVEAVAAAGATADRGAAACDRNSERRGERYAKRGRENDSAGVAARRSEFVHGVKLDGRVSRATILTVVSRLASVLMPMPKSEASAVLIGEAVTGADVCDGRSVKLPDGRSERIAASAVQGAGAGMTRPVSGTSSRVRAWRRSGMAEHRARRPRQFDLDCEDGRRKSSWPDRIVRRTFAPRSQASLPARW